MKNLENMIAECQQELAAINIKTGTLERYTINNRAKRRLGLCTHLDNNRYTIEISGVLLHESVPEITMKYVVIHELLHTCKGCMNHGDKWKKLVEKVNAAYGYTISSNPYSHERKDMDGVDTAKAAMEAPKHKFVCNGCGLIVNRYRESRFTKNPERFHCGRCGAKFTVIF